ncbi:MAG TPA: hypothetical protein ENI85_04295 [Deltaproteobacteria bacterium]|nr:hypothetical protein [Deltaproteobacteria bacterium]
MSGMGMADPKKMLWGLVACFVIVCANAGEAREGSERADPYGRWQPAVSFSAGVTTQKLDGSVSSSLGITPEATVRNDDFRSIVLRLDGTIYSPRLGTGKWAPRVFFSTGIERINREEINATASFESFDSAATIGNCTTNPISVTPSCDIETAVKLTSSGAWFAGIGLDLPFRALEQDFRISASVDYFGQTFKARGLYRTTVRLLAAPTMPEITNIEAFSDRLIVHGIGPQIRFGVGVLELGPVTADLFLGGQLYWLLSEHDDRFQTTTADGTGRFSYELDRFVARVNMGIQLNWRGME